MKGDARLGNVRRVIDINTAVLMAHSHGATLQDIMRVSESTFDSWFSAACTLLQSKALSEAKDAFLLLVTLSPNREDCLLNLGVVHQQLGDNAAALECFGRAAVCGLGSPMPHLYAAESYLEEAKKSQDSTLLLSEAFESLRLAYDCGIERPEYAAVRSRILYLMDVLKKQRKPEPVKAGAKR